jgi:hypothetical protein
MGNPTRKDGRIEPGQKLGTAISARAWNRAQDAADIVLGERVRFGGDATAQPAGLRTIVAAIRKTAVNQAFAAAPEGVSLSIGTAVDLIASSSTMLTTVPADEREGMRVLEEADMPPLSEAKGLIRLSSLAFGFSESFGVVSSIGETTPEVPADADYILTLVVGGVFRCLVYSFGAGTRVSGAFPIPPQNSDFPPSLWRPYPVVAAAGTGSLLATGAYYKLDEESEWPRLYEAVIRL